MEEGIKQAPDRTFTVSSRTFRLELASDVIRDGMSLFCYEVTSVECEATVLEVFYGDEDRRFTITAHQASLPLELVERVIAAARKALPPSY